MRASSPTRALPPACRRRNGRRPSTRLIAHMRDGRIADGFVAAIDLCGSELAKNFPRREASRDELPNRIYLI